MWVEFSDSKGNGIKRINNQIKIKDMKKINIPLPKIEGIELKNATVDLKKGVVVAEYGQEDIEKDISEIAVNLESAVDYLYEDLHEYDFITTKKYISKLEALSQLMILAEAWNNFDGFYPDWEDLEQKRYYPLFRLDKNIIDFSHAPKARVSLDTHTSSFTFKSAERAEQFATTFIDLFRIVLTNK